MAQNYVTRLVKIGERIYAVDVYHQEGRAYTALVRDVLGAIASGDTEEEAIAAAKTIAAVKTST